MLSFASHCRLALKQYNMGCFHQDARTILQQLHLLLYSSTCPAWKNAVPGAVGVVARRAF